MHKFTILTSDAAEAAALGAILSAHGDVASPVSVSEARTALAASPVDVLFADYRMLVDGGVSYLEGIGRVWQGPSGADVVVLVDADDVRGAVDAVRAGAADYLSRPLEVADVLRVLEQLDKSRILHSELDSIKDQFWNEDALEVVRTSSPAMREVFHKVSQMAGTRTTVLLTGETGTGKSLIARLIHSHSARKNAPFVSVHCGAIPDTLIESELFGHVKGAFTGAVRNKPGKFRQAEGGTLFLDEIGTISQSMQVKLLSALQDRMIQSVGGDEDIPVDVRVIAATNDDLLEMCERGVFRKDLYYRLNVFPIEIPPLRERQKDIMRFADVFISHFNLQLGKNIQGVEPKVLEAFQRYAWPGNVRELENLVERACILEEGDSLSPRSIPQEFFGRDRACSPDHTDISLPLGRARQEVVDRFERAYLNELLAATHGRIKDAAKWAGVTPRQLHKLMTRHNIRRSDFRAAQKRN